MTKRAACLAVVRTRAAKKMRVQHIVGLNCQSAPLKIGHTAESSGGCGTRQEEGGGGGEEGLSQETRAHTRKKKPRERKEILLKPQKTDDVNRNCFFEEVAVRGREIRAL